MQANLCVWCPDKGVPLEQPHESYLSLQQSKPHPNTVARSKTKWHVTELWSFGFLLWCEPIKKRFPGRQIKHTTLNKRITYLSGLNFSGSSQYCGSWWSDRIGIMILVPFWMVIPFTVVVFRHTRSVLKLMVMHPQHFLCETNLEHNMHLVAGG